MFQLHAGKMADPIVKTSDFGGLSCEDLAELCADKIISVAENAPPAIREQAKFFRERVQRANKPSGPKGLLASKFVFRAGNKTPPIY